MKIKQGVVCGFIIYCSVGLYAHVKKEEGWFYQYVRYIAAESAQKRAHEFEKKQDGVTDSSVVLIHGNKAFNKFVVDRSYQQPVVVKFFSQQSVDSLKVRSVYQSVADSLAKEIAFAAVDIIENNDIFVQIMATCRLTQVAMPLFLFYKDGHLYAPHHEPSIMVQGYLTKENLESFIKNKFSLAVTNESQSGQNN